MKTDPQKPVIRLYAAGFGLIVPHPSGVYYSNQTGGFSCSQPALEGIYLPLDADVKPEFKAELDQHFFFGPKYRGHCYNGIDEETASFLDKLFTTEPATNDLQIQVDRSKLQHSMEAWIHVLFKNNDEHLFTFPGNDQVLNGVVTWPNSD
jgi:hypothetical protein